MALSDAKGDVDGSIDTPIVEALMSETFDVETLIVVQDGFV